MAKGLLVRRSAQSEADPTQLITATTSQTPDTTAYNALSVGSIAAGGSYTDPTTGITIYKLTSATYPTTSSNWGHDYAEGGQEISLPHTGTTRTIKVYRWVSGGHWLIDWTPGTGLSNARQLTGSFEPFQDLSFTFSSNPATPYYAYVCNGVDLIRFDIRTMTQVDGGGWPVAGEDDAVWLQQSKDDSFFCWMRGPTGSVAVGYEPGSSTLKTHTETDMNEPHIDREGRYVGINLDTPGNGLDVWDWQANTVTWSGPGDPGIPYGHCSSGRRRWVNVDWNLSFPQEFCRFKPDVVDSAEDIGGPAPSYQTHTNCTWIQESAAYDDQWMACVHYSGLVPTSGSGWLAPGGIVLMTPNGQRKLLCHTYNTSTNYSFFSFAKFSPDGKYLMFTSNMNGGSRSDVFLAELPTA